MADEPQPEQKDARAQINDALEELITPEQIRVLFDEVLKITKTGRGWCPKCNKAVMVEVADAKAVASAISDMLNQAKGRPTEQKQDTSIVVNRRVILVADHEPEEPS